MNNFSHPLTSLPSELLLPKKTEHFFPFYFTRNNTSDFFALFGTSFRQTFQVFHHFIKRGNAKDIRAFQKLQWQNITFIYRK